MIEVKIIDNIQYGDELWIQVKEVQRLTYAIYGTDGDSDIEWDGHADWRGLVIEAAGRPSKCLSGQINPRVELCWI